MIPPWPDSISLNYIYRSKLSLKIHRYEKFLDSGFYERWRLTSRKNFGARCIKIREVEQLAATIWKYNAEFPECSHFRAREHEGDVITGPLPSGYPSLDWVHIEPRRTFGPWGYSSSRINPATSRTSPRTEAIVAKIEENWGWTGRGFWETFKGKIHPG